MAQDTPESYSVDVERAILAINEYIAAKASCFEGKLGALAREAVLSGGKRLRPVLLSICFSWEDTARVDIMPSCAAIEFFHTATLVHDDIIDRADTRRNVPTIHARYGDRVAALVGDYLFSKALEEISIYRDSSLVALISQVGLDCCMGELMQIGKANRVIDEETYIGFVARKTARLFSVAAYLGAKFSSKDEACCNLFEEAGLRTGIAYQILDDVLDMKGDGNRLGKEPGSDIRDGICTLPVIYALQELGKSSREGRFLELFFSSGKRTKEDVSLAISLIFRTRAVERCLQKARSLFVEAASMLQACASPRQVLDYRAYASMIMSRFVQD